MKHPHRDDASGADPEALIDAYLDETLSPEQGAALNAWVKESPANARRFAMAAWLHRQVYDQLHVRDLQQLQDDAESDDGLGGLSPGDSGAILAQLLELERGAGEGVLVDLTEELKRRDLERRRKEAARQAAAQLAFRREEPVVARVLVIPKLLAYGAIAAVVLGLLSVVYVVGWGNRPVVNDVVVENPPVEVAPESAVPLPPVVAELVSGQSLVWADASISTRPGTPLRKGSLVLESGIAQVRFQSGAVATFRGPAVIELRGDNRMALAQGTMVANVPQQAYGFTVDTQTMRVVDLGTEFAVTAEAAGDSAVQVFVGEVTAAAFNPEGRPGPAASLKSRSGVAVDVDTRAPRAIEVDGRAFADLAPHVALLYRNLVINGDFEQGQPGTITGERVAHAQNVEVVGWEDAGPGTVLRYDEAAVYEYPDPARDAMPQDRGQNYYLGMAQGTIRQRIEVADLAALIDADAVGFDLSAWLGGFEDQDEYLQLSVRFLDGQDRPVNTPLMLDPVRVADRQKQSGFFHRSASGRVPAGTRSIVIEMDNKGSHTPPFVRDGYADNISLVLSAD